MSDREKFFAAILIFSVWGFFAYQDKSLIPGYLQALRDALLTLGVFKMSMTIPPGSKP